jgi:hypothetical protein
MGGANETAKGKAMTRNAKAFFYEWIETNVPYGANPSDKDEAEKLVGRLAIDSTRKGISLDDMGLDRSSALTMIMEALSMPPDDQPPMPISGKPFFPT